MDEPAQTHAAPQAFPQTRWSVVLAATQRREPEAAPAMEALCRAYWYPLYAYARRCGRSAHDAQDLTRGFFCRLIEKHWLDTADRAKGRLRTFLVVALKRFMATEWRHASAQRRGGGRATVAFDTAFAESRLAADPSPSRSAEASFDREWALALLDRTLDRLRTEFAAAGKPDDFGTLKGSLMAERGTMDYGVLADRLGASEGVARVAVHRLRKRFRELFREEISRTLEDGADVDAEVRHLVAALG